MINKKEVGERLTRLRLSAGKTQAKAAEDLHCASGTLRGWERGRHLPQIGLLNDIAELYGVSAAYILFGDGEDHGKSKEQEDSGSRLNGFMRKRFMEVV